MTSDTQPDPDHKYWAFISYSQHDAALANRLHRWLEGYQVPRALVGRREAGQVIPRRLVPVFRDRNELASAADLAHEIREALAVSRTLIVICSRYSAVSKWVEQEIRTFKALGRKDRVFPLIIDGEPNATENARHESEECFAPSLRFDFTADGTPTKPHSEPIAADARDGKDGWKDACLKLVAGILHVPFDALRRRELMRQRRRRLGIALAGFAALVAFTIGYIGLADADFSLPGGAELRRRIDRCGCSVFRQIADQDQVAQAVEALRARLRHDIFAAAADGGISQGNDRSVWSIAQLSAAALRDPQLTRQEFQVIVTMLERALDGDYQLKDGKRIGWKDADFWPRADPVLWSMMAITAALQRRDFIEDAQRQRLVDQLANVQEMAEAYYPLRDGGWNVFALGPREQHYVYTSGFALHALLHLNSAGLCWRGDCARLEQMIADTAGWLTRGFVVEGGVKGWRRVIDDELPPVADLGLVISGSLVQAHLQLGTTLSEPIKAAAMQQLADLKYRFYHPAYQEISNAARYTNESGQTQLISLTIRVIWYPWAVEALVNWLHYAHTVNAPPETKRALERSLGHLIVTLSPAMLTDMANAPKWVKGEIGHGLGALRRETLSKWLQ